MLRLCSIFSLCFGLLSAESYLYLQDGRVWVDGLRGVRGLSRRTSLAFSPCLSPDFKRVAYRIRDGRSGRRGLAIADLNGQKQPQVFPLDHLFSDRGGLSWTADGRFLIYAAFQSDRRKSDLYQLELQTGKVRNLTPFPASREVDPVVSPDGQWIAFTSDRLPDSAVQSGTDSLWLISASGEGAKPLTNNHEFFWEDIRPSWSPDSQKIAFYRWAIEPLPYSGGKRGLWIIDLTSGEERFLTPMFMPILHQPAQWSPDGHWIAFTHGDDAQNTVRVMNLETGVIKEAGDLAGRATGLSWSTDSRKLLFTVMAPTAAHLIEFTLDPLSHRKLPRSDGRSQAHYVKVE